jgi:CRISPR-associated protein Cst2
MSNFFASILTDAAVASNYAGRSEESITPLQRISMFGEGEDHLIISAESLRCAFRENAKKICEYDPRFKGIKHNRSRVHDKKALAVEFVESPNDEYWDDRMGFLILGKKEKKEDKKEKGTKGGTKTGKFRGDSVVRTMCAVSTLPWRSEYLMNQSPESNVGHDSGIRQRQILHTSFIHAWGWHTNDWLKKEWAQLAVITLGQMANVAGNQARCFYNMSPASLVIRLREHLTPGFDMQGFKDNDGKHEFPEVIEGILKGDFEGKGFYIGGKIIRQMSEQTIADLIGKGVIIERNCEKLLEVVANSPDYWKD